MKETLFQLLEMKSRCDPQLLFFLIMSGSDMV